MSEYPEHEKLKAIADKSQAIGDFLEWATQTHGLWLAEPVPNSLHGYFAPTGKRTVGLLAEFFDIDEDKIEAEKRAMLAALRGESS